MQPAPYIIGLTGGIGSGKSTVSGLFAALGAQVIDADIIARDVIADGTALQSEVLAHFGESIGDANGAVDRSRLRTLVFTDPTAKTWLENRMHPLIRAEIDRRIAAADGPYVLLVVPLLLESGQYGFVDRILVVDAPEPLQVARALSRDAGTEPEIRRIMATQVSRDERLARADDIIVNDSDLDTLAQQVATLHQRYERESANRHQTG